MESRACLFTSTGPFEHRAGEPSDVEVTLDEAARYRTPVTITHLAAVVEGTTEVASRQEWALQYTFAP
jgi:hypothetical protein